MTVSGDFVTGLAVGDLNSDALDVAMRVTGAALAAPEGFHLQDLTHKDSSETSVDDIGGHQNMLAGGEMDVMIMTGGAYDGSVFMRLRWDFPDWGDGLYYERYFPLVLTGGLEELSFEDADFDGYLGFVNSGTLMAHAASLETYFAFDALLNLTFTHRGVISDDGGLDVFETKRGNDQVFGKGGDDLIKGGLGHNRLRGGKGDDLLEGGRHDDVLIGGAGADTFMFTGGVQAGNDWIQDFEDGVDTLLVHSDFALGQTDGDALIEAAFSSYDGEGVQLVFSYEGGGQMLYISGVTKEQLMGDVLIL